VVSIELLATSYQYLVIVSAVVLLFIPFPSSWFFVASACRRRRSCCCPAPPHRYGHDAVGVLSYLCPKRQFW
jgi:hypothetical protein